MSHNLDTHVNEDLRESNEALRRELEVVRQERDALAAHVERLHVDFDVLVAHSYGVAGLHLNGVVAPWGDLTEGGRLEEWLLSFSETPTTSLVRLKAEWQADALTSVIEEAPLIHSDMLLWIDERIRTLHAQSQEPTHD